MSNAVIATLGFVVLFGLMALRVPIGVAMGIVGVGGFAAVNGLGPGLSLLMSSPLSTATDYTLSVIPMFILMGVFASAGGMSRELFEACQAWVGHHRGGIAVGTMLACAGFSAINGSAVATAATMATTALPEMRRAGYPAAMAAGTVAAGGTLGVIIPPSVVMIIYGILTQQDISRLFMAGILPGLLALVLYVLTIAWLVRRHPERYPAAERQSWRVRFRTLKNIWAIVLLFVGVLGAAFGGLVTITEAAGVGAVGAALIGVLRRRLNLSSILDCLIEALRVTASIFVIAIGAYLFGYFLTVTQVTQSFVKFMLELPVGPYGILLIIVGIYIILGAIMDELAILLLTIPIVFPVITTLGFDPVWFGVIIVMTTTLGLITPPVGMNVFVLNSIARDLSLGQIYRGVAPFILTDMVRLLIIIAVPWLSLVIPESF